MRPLHCQYGGLASDKDRRNHARKNNHVTQRQNSRLDQAIGFWIHARNTTEFLGALRERQVKIIFGFIPIGLTHSILSILSLFPLHIAQAAVPGGEDAASSNYSFNTFHSFITSAVTNIEPADNTMLPSFDDNSSARTNASLTGIIASDSAPACSANS